MYKLHNYCRACGYAKPGANGIKAAKSESLVEVFDLGIQPLANDFCKEGEERAGYAPLKVLFCPRCSLAQLSVVVDPVILYRNYHYVTSPSEMMRNHFETMLKDIKEESDGKTVLEIGSNDGRLLMLMKEHGYGVIGVDPASNLTEISRKAGLTTMTGLFCHDYAKDLCVRDIVIARHVFCHVDDWQDFVKGLEVVTHQNSLVCIEFAYGGDTLVNCEFDQIYHEHLSFLNVKAMTALLQGTPFHIHRIIRYPIHGGALMFMLRRDDRKPHESVAEFKEDITLANWRNFEIQARDQINRLASTVHTARAQRKTVAALGASAKSTVWITACGFKRKDIAFIADNTPQKQLTFSPGTDIPIVDEGAILRDLPDYVVLFAWNYRDEILKKFSLAREKGVKFIIPVPTVETV